MSARRLVLCLALAFALAACAPEPMATSDGSALPEPTGCASDADCPADLACVVAAGLCSAQGALPYPLSVSVTPIGQNQGEWNVASAPVPTQWPSLELSEAHERNWKLATPVIVEGPIEIGEADVDGVTAVPVQVVATTPSDILGWPDTRITGRVVEDPSAGTWTYRIALLPDRLWRFTLYFDTPDLPPVVLERFVTNERDGKTHGLVAGQVALAEGSLRFADGRPVEGVRVVAESSEGDATYSSSLTDPQGSFRLRVPAELADLRLRVKPTQTFPSFPEQTVEGAFQAGDWAAEGTRLDLVVPDLPPLRLMRLRTEDPQGMAVPDVPIRLQGQAAGGTVSVDVISDLEGLAEATLYDGTYAWTASPLEGADAGVAQGAFEVAGADAAVGLRLSPKVAARLDVFDEPTGDALAGVDVFLSLVELLGDGGGFDRRYHFVADVTGVIETRLEPGTWRLLVVPSEASARPRFSVSDLAIVPDGPAVPVTVPAPWVLHGRVVDPSGQPVGNASIQAIRADLPGSKRALGAQALPANANERRSLTVIGEAVSDETGAYSLLLPFAP